MEVYKRKTFYQWQRKHQLSDSALAQAAKELEDGLVDAALGGFLYKKRIARTGGGKRAGYRVFISACLGRRHIFLYGLSKNDKSNITHEEMSALQFAGKVFLSLDAEALFHALSVGVLIKVNSNEQAH
ncbi:MAG TPA: type II toxin-antitoxin system RelE/ParE family toxin [Pusillimonas sp.]|uniref:type II toxin-antitoxin system RelE/ParE family toxin n=1 Tax=Pusillimonas sp. TaxID=3040095 RepID=UPI002B763792|nr:type II toxin-antitoxin system RelE/ParE family toxin [Pusillimonas sp.]HUH87000.1 type II toxin-antitoxin system RelE/ParE family toxin [Pusillimonas sp.]